MSRQRTPLSHYFTSVLSQQKTSVLSQQQTSVLSQQQTSVLSQQQTSVLSQQKTSILSQQQPFGPEPAELWPGTRGTLKLKVVSGLPVGASPTRAVARMTAVQQTPSNKLEHVPARRFLWGMGWSLQVGEGQTLTNIA